MITVRIRCGLRADILDVVVGIGSLWLLDVDHNTVNHDEAIPGERHRTGADEAPAGDHCDKVPRVVLSQHVLAHLSRPCLSFRFEVFQNLLFSLCYDLHGFALLLVTAPTAWR